MRTGTLAFAIAGLLLVPLPAHAFVGAVGWVGYGHIFQEGDDDGFGPTLEIGGGIGVALAAVDLTYWNTMDEASDSSQLRLGGRVTPPILPFYGRLAIGLPLDGDVRDASGLDVVFGAGWRAVSIPLVKIVVEVDYHKWTAGTDGVPLELKVGAVIGF